MNAAPVLFHALLHGIVAVIWYGGCLYYGGSLVLRIGRVVFAVPRERWRVVARFAGRGAFLVAATGFLLRFVLDVLTGCYGLRAEAGGFTGEALVPVAQMTGLCVLFFAWRAYGIVFRAAMAASATATAAATAAALPGSQP